MDGGRFFCKRVVRDTEIGDSDPGSGRRSETRSRTRMRTRTKGAVSGYAKRVNEGAFNVHKPFGVIFLVLRAILLSKTGRD